ncbi:MAG: hypothetical protein OXF23_05125 [Candidatus Dadabacteria bacterium]|nr:hypothetical protein [Candidatus Dadabacteria bacterium]
MERDHRESAYELLFGIRRSIRYHTHRRRFFEAWNTLTVSIAMLGSSSAIVSFIALAEAETTSPWIPIAISAFVAFTGALDFAIGTGRRSNEHGDLARQFISLEIEFGTDQEPSEVDLDRLTKERLKIEAREPVALRLLDAMCHYELLRAMGDESDHPRVSLFRRSLMHFFSQAVFARELPVRSAPRDSLSKECYPSI